MKAAGHGGQVLVTKSTRDLVDGRLGGGFGLKRLGEFRLRDLSQPELIYQLTHAACPPSSRRSALLLSAPGICRCR